jgi:hypothetical protein
MKIICKAKEKERIIISLGVSDYCPFGAVDIYGCDKDGCESCVKNRIEWEVTDDGSGTD